jgi:ABC-2 type transport system ATP-binding protein
MPPIVEIRNLKKRYLPTPGAPDGNLAVKGISLTIERGEIYSLLGPNGAGKTTTISMMSGLITPSEGEVIIDGHSLRTEPLAVKQALGVVPQEIALYPQLSARQNLEFFGQLYGLRGAELAKRADNVLDVIGLSDRQKERVESYSGGMKRRVNIGVALLHQPKVVFMDEPTVGIDPQSRRNILDTVKTLNGQGMSVLYTTHYMEEAQELSKRVGIIDHGELIASGTQSELMQKIGEKDTILIVIGDQAENAVTIVKAVPGVASATNDNGTLKLLSARGRQTLPAVIKSLSEAGIALHSVEVKEPNLEAVFLQLTGRALRD